MTVRLFDPWSGHRDRHGPASALVYLDAKGGTGTARYAVRRYLESQGRPAAWVEILPSHEEGVDWIAKVERNGLAPKNNQQENA